ncbi:MAG: TVP38/TMEM64 family protein [Pseudonocardia sp.]|nr:TVP38/TMEM64 family protein [Pseudonocardia sp.]
MRRRRMVGAAALAVLIVAALVVLGRLGPDGLNAAAVQDAVRDVGAWAPALFVVLQVLVTVPPVPRTIFTVAAGLLFGSVLGVVIAVVATALAAAVAFWLVRVTGGGFMDRFADRGPVVWTRRRLDRSGLLAVTSLRLIPALPFALLNYAAGLSGVRFTPYLLGTVLGTAPGTIALVVLGDAVTGRVSPALLAVSVTGGLVGTVGAVVVARRPHLDRAPSLDRRSSCGPIPQRSTAGIRRRVS